MTSAAMLARTRVFLDEATADFYLDASIYIALSESQREITSILTNAWYKNKSIRPIPKALEDSLNTVTSTIGSGLNSYAATNIIKTISMKWNPTGAVASGKYCIHLADDNNSRLLIENPLLSTGYYVWWDTNNVYVNPVSAHASAGFTHKYIQEPSEIADATPPSINNIAHEAVIERALWILLADDEKALAQAHLQLYGKLLEGLKE